MIGFILNLYESDKQALALYLQAFATIMIGLLAWAAARGQNVLAEKSARKELFKLRFENIYQETNLLFSKCIELTEEYRNIRNIKSKKKKKETIERIQNDYHEIQQNFYQKMESNKFLIKPKDYDKLISFCNEYTSSVQAYIYGKRENESCPNFCVVDCFNRHYKIIPQILSSYLYYENESKLSFWLYKIFKYLKKHMHLFLLDYFPSLCEIISTILLILLLILGILYTLLEFIKEILKAPILVKNGKIKFDLKMKSPYLKRNRPWPL